VSLSVKSDDYTPQVAMYNAESQVDLVSRFVTHEGCNKLYVGGLARIPFLIGYGAMLRVVSNVTYFDKLHSDGSWTLLDDEDSNIEVSFSDIDVPANDKGEIGLVLAMSTPIHSSQLPSRFNHSTYIAAVSGSVERNKVKNQDNLHRISNAILNKIDKLSSRADVKSIHLFFSIQSSLAIEIGRRYQEGTHKDWIIHNYDAKNHCYPWSLRLSRKLLAVESSPNTEASMKVKRNE